MPYHYHTLHLDYRLERQWYWSPTTRTLYIEDLKGAQAQHSYMYSTYI